MLLTPSSAAAALGVSTRTLARYHRDGRIKETYHTPGGVPRYSEENIKEFMASCPVHTKKFPGFRNVTTASSTSTGYDAGRTHRESLKTRDAGEATKLYGRFLIEGSRGSRTGGVDGLTVSVALDGYVAEHVDKNVVDKERQYDIVGHLKAYFGDTLDFVCRPAREPRLCRRQAFWPDRGRQAADDQDR